MEREFLIFAHNPRKILDNKMPHDSHIPGTNDSRSSVTSFTDASISTIGVLGAGQMGAAAAVMFKRAGFRVMLWTRNAEKLSAVTATLDTVDKFLNEHVGAPAVVALRDKQ